MLSKRIGTRSGTTTQLAGARSTIEIIAQRAGLLLRAYYAKSERNSVVLFSFYAPGPLVYHKGFVFFIFFLRIGAKIIFE